MGKRRTPQDEDKPEPEPARSRKLANNKELLELRADNRRLKRALNRALKRLAQLDPEHVADVDERMELLKQQEKRMLTIKKDVPTCPSCGSTELREFETPGNMTVVACTDCRWRKGVGTAAIPRRQIN